MKFILQYIRSTINKVFYKQKALFSNVKKHDILITKIESNYDPILEMNRAYIKQILYVGPSMGLVNGPEISEYYYNNAFETNGLLELGNKYVFDLRFT